MESPLLEKELSIWLRMIGEIEGITDLSMTSNAILLGKYAGDLKQAGLDRINISLDTMDTEKYSYLTRGGDINAALEGIDAAINAGLLPVKINCVIKDNHDEPDAVAVTKFAKEKGIQIRYIKEMSLSGGKFSIVEGGDGGNCAICNRLRLTANGMVKPCLFNNLEFSVRDLGYEEALRQAVDQKPKCGSVNNTSNFYNLGG